MISKDKSDKVLEILENESSSLKYLAYISGIEPFVFYRSAHLIGLNLIGQDLTGLNFDNADLTGAELDNIIYDVGAFNNAIIPEEFFGLVDGFDSYFLDLHEKDIDRVYLFVKIRDNVIDRLKDYTGHNYADLAETAGISSATLRKARRGEALMIDTARSLISLFEKLSESGNWLSDFDWLRQPCIRFTKINYAGGFKDITRSEFVKYLEIAHKVYVLRKEQKFPSYIENWRDGPGMLDWYNRFYFEGKTTERPPTAEIANLPLDFGLFSNENGPTRE